MAIHTEFRALQRALLLALITSSCGALAHGPQQHGHAAPSAAAAEQKPWGIAGDPARVTRTIEVRMRDDMRFHPSRLTVRQGETVRLRAVNRGRVLHEIVLGTPEELAAHAALMKKHPNMEHDEPHMAHVAPGQRGDIIWHFNRAGDFQFACLIPGHFEAGMIGHIRVEPTTLETTR